MVDKVVIFYENFEHLLKYGCKTFLINTKVMHTWKVLYIGMILHRKS